MSEKLTLTGFPNDVDSDKLIESLEGAFKSVTGVDYYVTLLDLNPGDISDDILINVQPLKSQSED